MLIFFGFMALSSAVVIVSPIVKRGRDGLQRMAELVDKGVAAEGRLVRLDPVAGGGGKQRARARYEFVGPAGETAVLDWVVDVVPDMEIGRAYPMVRHPQYVSRAQPGTSADLAEEHRRGAKFVQGLKRIRLGLVAFGLMLIATAAVLIATTEA
ncbi:hypothetical protein [Streptomyces sp. NPDC057494]|uniref:hypothetical protein n=1 Tax=Streptomyces sp. NPDC057494 TaxID=3346148 RepID=UPI0036A70FF3